jgi:CheY-like chemotaxis protein
MGGSVGCESSPGHGARFFLRLPLAATTAPAPVPTGTLPNSTVLLVEDTDYNAWAASAVLAKLGLSCERARTGEEALRMFGERRFNVVLLDRNLPDMDGLEVARRIRAMETDGLQSLLLAVTAYCTAEDRALCLEAGMDAFIGKPLTPEKLRKVLLTAGQRMVAGASVQVAPEHEAPALPATPAVALDMSLLTYLSDGSADGLRTQIGRFVATLEEAKSQMAEAAQVQDFSRMAVCAHRLLGQAKMVGGTALADAASSLDAAASSADALRCEEWLGRVSDEIQSLKEALHRRPAEQSA